MKVSRKPFTCVASIDSLTFDTFISSYLAKDKPPSDLVACRLDDLAKPRE